MDENPPVQEADQQKECKSQSQSAGTTKQMTEDLKLRIKNLQVKFPKLCISENVDANHGVEKNLFVRKKMNLASASESSNDGTSSNTSKPAYVSSKIKTRYRKNIESSQSLKLDSMNKMIFDMLQMTNEKREKFLVKLAKERRIFVKNSENLFDYNPILFKKNPYLKSYLHRNNTNQSEEDQENVDTKPAKKKYFDSHEEYVNFVTTEGLTEEQQLEFKLEGIYPEEDTPDNYIETHKYIKHLEEYAQKCVDNGFGIIVESVIRVNSKNNIEAYFKIPNHTGDALIVSYIGRKFALHGDAVRAFVRTLPVETEAKFNDSLDNPNDSEENPDDSKKVKYKAFVIDILEKMHPRLCVCLKKKIKKKDQLSLKFQPRDPKIPTLFVDVLSSLDKIDNPWAKGNSDALYLLKITGNDRSKMIGEVVDIINKCSLAWESKATLLEYGLDVTPYDEKFSKMYENTFEIPEKELKVRTDLRNDCIFTIDPETAKDLDDAVSCNKLSDGNYEVGVHIADVSYFLEENCELDELVKKRATTVYLVNEVYHMLPKTLCMQCSLLPGQSRLSFSIIWVLNELAEIISTKFVKSIMNSCVQLSYEHAQEVIDSTDESFVPDNFPEVHNNINAEKICNTIKMLQKLATKLKERRFENGALKLDKPKLCFVTDPETNEPLSFKSYESKEANFMIEEFMLLANQSVAKHIYENYPNLSILRNHAPPVANSLKTLSDELRANKIELDITSSKTLANSVKKICNDYGNTKAIIYCVNTLLAKPMTRARYFCSNNMSSDSFWHYALSIPIYTHFTSPIRRYPDILVHRLLNAAVKYSDVPKRTPVELGVLAEISNRKKYDAKLAGEANIDSYFIHYIKKRKTLLMKAAVLDVKYKYFDVILVETGHNISIKFADYKNVKLKMDSKPYTAIIASNTNQVNIGLFTELDVEVWVENNQLCAKVLLKT